VLSCRANAVVVARQLWLDVVLTLTSQSAASVVVDVTGAVAVGASTVTCGTRACETCCTACNTGTCGAVQAVAAVVVVVVGFDAVAGALCRGVTWLRAAVEGIGTLFTAGKGTALALEFGHAHGWESSGGVVLGSVVVDLVDWHGGVHDVWLDSLLVDDGLNLLMHMVVDMLASNDWLGSGLVLTLNTGRGIFEACLLSSELLLHLIGVVMLKVAVLDTDEVVVVLLWEDLSVLHRLDGSVVVILVDLLVDGGSDAVFLLTSHGLVDDCRVDFLVDSSVMLAILVDEALHGVLCGIHDCGVD